MIFKVIGIVALVALIFLIFSYNSLVAKRNEIKNSFGALDAFLKKRHDLIPNLIATVQAYMKHESDLLVKITSLRSKAMSPNISSSEKVGVENNLNKAMGGLMVAVENYPDLKANESFLKLQGSMNEVEEQISAARRSYNSSVTSLNNAIEMFPSSLVANSFQFKKENVLETPIAERKNINAKELFNG